uniref:RanBD1 domain-containing protein n=1 Tax=Alexandrium monilatum TaxID=311494 RepID=A0A7S4SG42_9DINO
MKRPAEVPLEPAGGGGAAPPDGGGGNPFAGISLSSPVPAGSLFAAAVAGSAPGEGFAPAAPAAEGAAAAAPGGTANGKPANPFMGLSLFSPPASGGLFTAAANSLPQGASEASAAAFPGLSGGDAAVPPAAPATGAGAGGAAGDEAPEPEEVPQEAPELGEPTGEEEEEVVFRAECRLWKLVRQASPAAAVGGAAAEGAAAEGAGNAGQQPEAPAGNEVSEAANAGAPAEERGWHWQERGCGIVHINRHGKTGAGRLVMRMRGVLKLLLNTPVFPTTKYERVGQKSVRFVGVDAEAAAAREGGRVSLCAYRLNLQSGDQQGRFLAALGDLLGAPTTAA